MVVHYLQVWQTAPEYPVLVQSQKNSKEFCLQIPECSQGFGLHRSVIWQVRDTTLLPQQYS
jgi:predicted DNA-binding transcriptional regulator AlpA